MATTNIVHTHTCDCGQEIITQGWNNNVHTILRCETCTQRRQALLAQINEALQGRNGEVVYISGNIRHLIEMTDFPLEICYRRDEKMNGEDFQIA